MSVRVLVVDDQEPFRLAAAAVVAAADGFELVGSTDTGEASVAAVEELQPDLVLMDIHLPGIDGLESTRQIRARRPAVRVLLVSSSDGYADPEECGAMGYLSKQRLSPDRLRGVWADRQPQPSPRVPRPLPNTDSPPNNPDLEGVRTMTIPGTGQADRQDRKDTTPQEAPVEQLSVPQSLALHLLPGIVLATIFYGAAPWVMRAGFPAIVSGMLGAVVAILGLELGWLLYQARRRSGRFRLSAVLPYRPGRFTWRKVLLVVGLWAWGLGASFALADLKPQILQTLFWWVPGWATNPFPRDIAQTASSTVLVVTGVVLLLFNVILGPLVEELYFRGYLLPRLHRFGIWAPLINISLFATYHFHKPWDLLTLIVILLPMGYAVWRTRDIRIGIAVHIGLNGTGFLTNSLPTLLAG